MNEIFGKEFIEIEQLFYHCEEDNSLVKVESILKEMVTKTSEPKILARIYGKLAQIEAYRYDYVPENERLKVAEKGVKLAKKGLEYDERSIDANAWAAATMGIHGLEMGILSSLFYIGPIRMHTERVLELDERYHYAQPHLIIGELYRLSPPSPVGIRNMAKALEHLQRSTELGPEDPQSTFHLAELYVSLRKKDMAKEVLNSLLEKEIIVRGPIYSSIWKAKAGKLLEKLG